MCGILPEVDKFCFVGSLRIGMLFIGVLAVITGALTLSIIEQQTGYDYKTVKKLSEEVYQGHGGSKEQRFRLVEATEKVFTKLAAWIKSTICFISVLFIIAGFLLLIATLMDQETCFQGFISLVMLNVFLGFVLVIAVVFECMMKDECTLSDMDWLSGAALIVLIVADLILWIYFIVVVNSYAGGTTF